MRNEQLPAHLERREEVAAVPEEMLFCSTHGERVVIGYDYRETLMFDPPKMWVRRLAIPKLGSATIVTGCAALRRLIGLPRGWSWKGIATTRASRLRSSR